MRFMAIAGSLAIMTSQSLGDVSMRDPERTIMAVELASLAGNMFYCSGGKYDKVKGEKMMARAISAVGKERAKSIAKAAHERLQQEYFDDNTLFCAQARVVVDEDSKSIPLSFTDE